MEPENQDAPEVLETPEVQPEPEATPEPETPEEQQPDDEAEALRKENEELKKKNSQLFERAKKAEAKVPSNTDLTARDALVLSGAGITEETDIDEVVEFAKFKKLSVSEALKNTTLKGILDTKAEERRTAQATNTRGNQRGASAVTGDNLLDRAERTGEVPTDTEGMQKLFSARMARIKKGN